MICRVHFIFSALGVGHKIVLIISIPFSMFFYFHFSIYFIFSISYSGPSEKGE